VIKKRKVTCEVHLIVAVKIGECQCFESRRKLRVSNVLSESVVVGERKKERESVYSVNESHRKFHIILISNMLQ